MKLKKNLFSIFVLLSVNLLISACTKSESNRPHSDAAAVTQEPPTSEISVDPKVEAPVDSGASTGINSDSGLESQKQPQTSSDVQIQVVPKPEVPKTRKLPEKAAAPSAPNSPAVLIPQKPAPQAEVKNAGQNNRQITVVDANGRRLPGAAVVHAGNEVTTNSQGQVQVDLKLQQGLIVKRPGYRRSFVSQKSIEDSGTVVLEPIEVKAVYMQSGLAQHRDKLYMRVLSLI